MRAADERPSKTAKIPNTNKTRTKTIKSPLRYPGGKSRAVETILELLPPGINTLVSPFFGGGSVELAAASSRRIRVHGYDAFRPLVLFWRHALDNPAALADIVREYHPLSRERFYALQAKMKAGRESDELRTAAIFYTLNRCSFSGTTMSGGMSPGHARFTLSAIARLRAFKAAGVSVGSADFTESVPRHENDFLYCDPPYANGGALYGANGDCHTAFDHQALAALLSRRDGWILSYNDCELVRDLYSGHAFVAAEWAYGMNTTKRSDEVLILSKDLRKP